MITLTDSIEIKTTPERIFDWFQNLDKHFTEWHPNHTKFVKLTGGMDVGDIVHFEERIDGKWFKFNFRITSIEKTNDGWNLETKAPFATIRFTVLAKGNSCIFTHTETFGFIRSKNPFVLNFIIPALKWVLNPIYRFDLVERDIVEDNLNLKRILECGDN